MSRKVALLLASLALPIFSSLFSRALSFLNNALHYITINEKKSSMSCLLKESVKKTLKGYFFANDLY
jgi:hypothetical protein